MKEERVEKGKDGKEDVKVDGGRKRVKKIPTNISLLLELLVIPQPTSRVQNLKDNVVLKKYEG